MVSPTLTPDKARVGGRYAHEISISSPARLCFVQTYVGMAGDSASAAELVVLLSALSEIPIDQGIALTGWVNQRGELQAMSGVNHTTDGLYAVCQALGLTGTQGVIIPRQNLKHLMLHKGAVEPAS